MAEHDDTKVERCRKWKAFARKGTLIYNYLNDNWQDKRVFKYSLNWYHINFISNYMFFILYNLWYWSSIYNSPGSYLANKQSTIKI